MTDLTNTSDEATPGTWTLSPIDGSWDANGETQEAAFEAALAFYVDTDISRAEARRLLRFDIKTGEVAYHQN